MQLHPLALLQPLQLSPLGLVKARGQKDRLAPRTNGHMRQHIRQAAHMGGQAAGAHMGMGRVRIWGGGISGGSSTPAQGCALPSLTS